jgi:hypothetical protein
MRILCITPHKKRDYLAECVIEGLMENGYELYCTDYGNGVDRVYSDDEIIKLGGTFDYVFAIWGKCYFNGVPPPKFYLIEKLNCWDRVVYVDGSEYNYTGFKGKTDETLNPIFLKRAKWYFKRECTEEHMNMGIYPLPFASYKNSFKYDFFNDNKNIDILCSWGKNYHTGLRKQCTEVSNVLRKEGYIVETEPQLDYYKSINNSWIVLDAYGGGECNARTFEILPNFGLPCIQKWSIKMPFSFTHGENILEYTNQIELYNTLKEFLKDKIKLKNMILNGNMFNKKHHTTKERVGYIFDIINKTK